MAIILPPNSTGTTVDTVTLAAKDREVIIVGGDTAAAEVAAVKNTSPASTAYRMAVGSIGRRIFDAALTVANLGISGNFTSAFFSTQDGGETFVEVVARADVASATDGFVIEESSSTGDANFTRTVASVTVSANTTTYLRAQVKAGNWRVNYTNGGTAQTSFRIAYAVSPVPIQSFLDYDTGTGVIPVQIMGLALPGAGGPVAGGTATNPVRTDPTGTTAQPVTDNAGSLTIDNAALSVTGGGVEATALRVTVASDSTGVLSVDDNAGSLTVDNATISVVGSGVEATAQRVTIATDSTGVLSVDDNAGSLTVDQATATSLKAEVVGPTADNAANPTAKVSVLSGVALAAAPTRTEGNVNPLRLNLAGDAAITLDGEAVVLGAGAAAIGSVTVTGTVDVSDRAARLVGQVEGRAASGAAKAGNPNQVGGVFNTVQPTVTTGQAVEAQFTARGAQIVAAGVEALNVTVNAALPTGANTIGTVNVGTFPDNEPFNVAQINGVTPLMGNGVTGTGSQRVTIASDNTAFAVNATLSAETTKVIGTVRAQGNVGGVFDAATGAAVPANAVQTGGRAATANPTAVTNAQLAAPMLDKLGRQVVVPGHVRDLVTQSTTTITVATEVSILAAGAAGVFHDLTMLTVANTSATGVRVDFRDVTAGAVVFSLYAPATQTVGFDKHTPITQTTAASAWTAQSSAAVTDLRIFVQAIKNI